MRCSTCCALIAALSATPAWATGGLHCTAPGDDSVEVSLTVGRVPGFAVVGAVFAAEGQAWSTPGIVPEATEIALAQAAFDADRIIVDYADTNIERIVAALRLVVTSTEDGQAAAGTLSIPGTGVWAVICEVE